MSSKRFQMVSKKVDADISHFMKLAKSRLNSKTESEALRQVLRKCGKEYARWLEEAQDIATKYGLSFDENGDPIPGSDEGGGDE